jgi:hypothetical protein
MTESAILLKDDFRKNDIINSTLWKEENRKVSQFGVLIISDFTVNPRFEEKPLNNVINYYSNDVVKDFWYEDGGLKSKLHDSKLVEARKKGMREAINSRIDEYFPPSDYEVRTGPLDGERVHFYHYFDVHTYNTFIEKRN